MSINRVMISGNLTRDPEVRTTASGSQILSFSVAVNDRRKDPSTGEWGDYANYIDCTLFGNRVDFFSRNLSKGTKVSVEGKLRWSQWEAKDGSGKRSKIEVIVDDIELMSRDSNSGSSNGSYGNGGNSRNSGGSSYNNYSYGNSGASAASPAIDPTSSAYDEDIPF